MFAEYLNEQGQPYVSPFIGKIKRRMSSDQTLGSAHPSSFGLAEFNHRATEAVLGKKSSAIVENRVRSKHRRRLCLCHNGSLNLYMSPM